MQISNSHKKRIISGVILCIMLLGVGRVLGELLRPFGYSTDIYNAEYEELKSRNQKLDMVIIGASRALVAFDPQVFEEKLRLDKVYNLSFSQQNMEGTYYQLKGFIEEFHPKYVIMDISEGTLTYTTVPKITRIRMLERLRGMNRLEYIANSFAIREYPYLVNVFSYRNNLSGIRSNIQTKKKFQNEGVCMKTETWQSKGNGFIAYFKSVPQGNIGLVPVKKFAPSQINVETKQYLDKCVRLCRDNDIQLIFVTVPTSMSYIYSITNYQDVTDYAASYARENGIPYYNLNYLKNKEKMFPDSVMYDYKHTNKQGATLASTAFADILAKEWQGIDTSEYFYKSVDELKKTVDRVVAVGAKPAIKNDIMKLSVKSFQNQDVFPSYQVLVAQKKNEFKPAVNWTDKKDISFNVPKGKRYRVLLRARHKENASDYAWMAWEVDPKGKIRRVSDIPEHFYKVSKLK